MSGWSPSARAQTRILCAGDSITAGYGVSVSYPTRLHRNTGLEVINAGVGGMWSSYGLDHIDEWMLYFDPTQVLILYGTNDTNDPYQDYRQSAEAVMETARKVRSYGAIPIIGTIPPKIGPREYQMPRVQTFNAYLRTHAANEGILLADIEAAFGSGSGLFQSDGFHPNDAGSEVIARTFADKIRFLALEPVSRSVSETGATGQNVAVTANQPWTALADQAWITITSGGSGTGNGTIVYDVAPNAGAARSGTITVANAGFSGTFTVQQAAATLALSPNSVALPSRAAAGRTFGVKALQAWTATADQPWIAIVGGGAGAGNGTVTYDVQANAGGARAGTITVSLGGLSRTFTVNQWPAATMPGVSAESDFDGDGWADLATFNPTSATWRVWFGTGTQWTLQWGSAGMVPVPADYNGDGLFDFALYQPSSGTWYVLESGGRSRKVQFGWGPTVPVPGDYDGDGKADLAIFNPASGFWYVLASAAGGYSAQWGWPGVVPVPADYDGDGAVDLGIYTPASGNWSILQSGNGQLLRKAWGAPTLVPVPGDYNSDGRADIAAFNRASGQWFAALTGGGSRTAKLGWASTVPVPADYDGDGQTDYAVYNRDSRIWYIVESSTGGLVKRPWGEKGDIPAQLTPQIHSWFGLP
ncbi:MAG: GDSL-type esterase/lipase family protein [Kiritimatiellia bacterium]